MWDRNNNTVMSGAAARTGDLRRKIHKKLRKMEIGGFIVNNKINSQQRDNQKIRNDSVIVEYVDV